MPDLTICAVALALVLAVILIAACTMIVIANRSAARDRRDTQDRHGMTTKNCCKRR